MNCKCKKSENLIEILQETQKIHGWLSPETLKNISDEIGIPLAKVIGVATFYDGFRCKLND
jgi:NADH:ubiquinone oxidoreductase subunit E